MGEEEDGSGALGSGEQGRAAAGAEEVPPPNPAEDAMEVGLAEKDDGAAKDLATPAGEPGGPLTAFIFAATELRKRWESLVEDAPASLQEGARLRLAQVCSEATVYELLISASNAFSFRSGWLRSASSPAWHYPFSPCRPQPASR